MFNFKISGIAAGAAFILSVLIGLFSGSGLLIILLRALIFAVVFFGLTCLIFWIIAQFVPELLNAGEDDLGFSLSGSRVDISVGDGNITGAFPSDGSESVDDIAGRPSAPVKVMSQGLDQGGNAGYNAEGEELGELEDAGDELSLGANSGGRSERAGSGDALPEIDGMTDTIPGSAADTENTGEGGLDSSEPRRPKSSSRKSEMAGDFNPKELAQAIQTVLKKDDKG